MNYTLRMICAAALLLSACQRARAEAPRKAPGVLLIGIDGASWKVILPLIREGKLPNIAKLRARGASGTIATLDFMVSPVIWATVVTGKTPEKHGIDGFEKYDGKENLTVPYRSYDRKTKAVWNILSERGRKVGVFNFLGTWPPEKVNGFLVSDYYARHAAGGGVYPPDLLVNVPGAQSAEEKFLGEASLRFERRKENDLIALKQNENTSAALIRSGDCDVFMAYIQQLDQIQHLFWMFREPEKFDPRLFGFTKADIAKYGTIIEDAYKEIDGWIGTLLDAADQDTTVIVLSDHGFKAAETPSHLPVSVDRILRKSGMGAATRSFWYHDGKDFTYISSSLPRSEFEGFIKGVKTQDGKPVFEIHESDKKGFMLALSQNKSSLRSPGEEITVGQERYKAAEFVEQQHILDNSGIHDYHDGIFIISGGPVKRTEKPVNASVYDVVPTILYLEGLPVAKDMDGRALREVLGTDYAGRRPVSYLDTYENGPAKPGAEEKINPADDDYKQHLRAAGYIQ